MPKKSLILYASMTGNTKKVALRFKQVFEKKGWVCDIFKVDNNMDFAKPPFNYDDYDFLCVGSPVISSLPVIEILYAMSKNPRSLHYGGPDLYGKNMDQIKAILAKKLRLEGEFHNKQEPKLIFGPQDKKGVVFVTLGGLHQGPTEAVAPLALLATEMEHLKFQCVGQFFCPGKMRKIEGWFEDLPHRPNERDLMKAQIFLEETIEDYYESMF